MTSVNNRGSPIKPYKVHSGDTLTGIAAKNGTTVAALAKTNHIPNPDKIYTGQTLRFPDQFDPGRGVRSGGPENSTARAKDPLPAGVKRNIDTIDARIGDSTLQKPSRLPSSPQISFPGSAVHINTNTTKHSSILGGDAFEHGKSTPNIDKPTSSSSDSTGVANAGNSAQVKDTSTDSSSLHAKKVPYYNQHDGGHGYVPSDTACFAAASAMVGDSGSRDTKVGSFSNRIQIGISENAQGRLKVDAQKAVEGRNYIDNQLRKGKPVVVGVSYADRNYNVDKLTDHFVTVTGRHVDDKGRTYYTFNDPFPKGGAGKDSNPSNRLYVDKHTGGLTGKIGGLNTDVAMVCANVTTPHS